MLVEMRGQPVAAWELAGVVRVLNPAQLPKKKKSYRELVPNLFMLKFLLSTSIFFLSL